jgi:hypothetical protein
MCKQHNLVGLIALLESLLTQTSSLSTWTRISICSSPRPQQNWHMWRKNNRFHAPAGCSEAYSAILLEPSIPPFHPNTHFITRFKEDITGIPHLDLQNVTPTISTFSFFFLLKSSLGCLFSHSHYLNFILSYFYLSPFSVFSLISDLSFSLSPFSSLICSNPLYTLFSLVPTLSTF